MLFLTNNGPATLLKGLTNLIVSEHATLAGVWTGSTRPGSRGSKTILILVGESESPTVEWHSKD